MSSVTGNQERWGRILLSRRRLDRDQNQRPLPLDGRIERCRIVAASSGTIEHPKGVGTVTSASLRGRVASCVSGTLPTSLMTPDITFAPKTNLGAPDPTTGMSLRPSDFKRLSRMTLLGSSF